MFGEHWRSIFKRGLNKGCLPLIPGKGVGINEEARSTQQVLYQ